ncbi:MAG TPA: hypothetical protein VKF37_04825, partial [Chloroflexota bacterium]|nr:hypothetical protein [Chloroflexota bacterium]
MSAIVQRSGILVCSRGRSRSGAARPSTLPWRKGDSTLLTAGHDPWSRAAPGPYTRLRATFSPMMTARRRVSCCNVLMRMVR